MAKKEPENTPNPADVHHPADERLKMLEAIADGADQVRAKDGEFDLTEEVEPEVTAADVEPEPEPIETKQEDGITFSGKEDAIPEPRKFKLKIGGVEREVTEEELLATAQKVSQADEYLRIAAETVKKAVEPVSPVKDEPEKVEEDDLALARALQMGSEEDAARAIHNLRNARPSVTPDDVRQIARQTLSLESVLAASEGKHKDLLSDPLLGKLFKLRLQEMKAEAPDTPIADAYDRIGEELQTRFPTQTEASRTQAKLRRKASVAPVPTAAARQATVAEEEGEENVQDVIAQIAKSRKQERPFH